MAGGPVLSLPEEGAFRAWGRSEHERGWVRRKARSSDRESGQIGCVLLILPWAQLASLWLKCPGRQGQHQLGHPARPCQAASVLPQSVLNLRKNKSPHAEPGRGLHAWVYLKVCPGSYLKHRFLRPSSCFT